MHEEKSKHHFRFYIIMITIVVGIIFLFLVLNDDSTLSGATLLGGEEKESETDTIEITGASIAPANTLASSPEKEIALTFDKIPELRKQAKFRNFEISFDNPGTAIKINDDRLELNNLEEVTLRIEDFSGEVLLSGSLFSMDGTAKLIEVNDMALYSKDELELAFNDLDYNYLKIEEIEMSDLALPQGDGSLQLTDKLSYTLDDESLDLNYFKGQMIIGAMGNDTLDNGLSLNGVVKGLRLSGSTLNMVIS